MMGVWSRGPKPKSFIGWCYFDLCRGGYSYTSQIWKKSVGRFPRRLFKSYCEPLTILRDQQVINISTRNLSRKLFSPLFIHICCRLINTTSSIECNNKGNGSLVRQNFHEECEGLINKQINMELHASYVYLSMAYYFHRDDVALPGMEKYFKKSAEEEREHAEALMKYMNSRGGRILLQPVNSPSRDEWDSPLEAVTQALQLEKDVNDSLLKMHEVADSHNDAQLCDFLESNFLEEQVRSIKELSDFVTQLKRCGSGLGEFIFDKEIGKKD